MLRNKKSEIASLIFVVLAISVAAAGVYFVGGGITGFAAGTFQPDANNRDAMSGGNDEELEGSAFAAIIADCLAFGSHTALGGVAQTGGQWSLNIPQGSKIISSNITVYYCNGAGSTNYIPRIGIYDVDNAPVFDATHTHPLSSHATVWSTTLNWTGFNLATTTSQTTPDLSALIQHVIDRPGWQPGNYIGVVIDGSMATSGNAYAVYSISHATGTPMELNVQWTAPPNITSLNYPSNGASVSYGQVNFNFTAVNDEDPIANCTLLGNFTGSWAANQTIYNVANNSQTKISVNLDPGNYLWNVQCTDNYGLSDFYESNYSVIVTDLTKPTISLLSPNNNSVDVDGNASFSCSAGDDLNLNRIEFYFNGLLNQSIPLTGLDNQTIFYLSNLNDGNYNWSCRSYDWINNFNQSPARYLTVNQSACPEFNNTYFSGQTTDWSSVPDITAVEDATLDNPTNGMTRWHNTVNALGADFNSNVKLENNSVDIDSANLHSSFNSSATVWLRNLNWESTPIVLIDGEICPPSVCSNVSYVNGTAVFNVTHFTNYSTTGNSQLEIWDETDPDKNNLTKYPGEQIKFYANYTRKNNGQPISGTCTIYFTDSSSSMPYNGTSLMYEYNRTFSIAGIKPYNVTCTGAQSITLSDSANVSMVVDSVKPNVTQIAPANNSVDGDGTVYFNCSAADETNLTNVSLYINNVRNQTFTVSGTSYLANFTKNLSNGLYTWFCDAYDAYGNRNTTQNRTLTVNTTAVPISTNFTGSTTDWSSEPDLSNVCNAVLDNPIYDQIKWYNCVNAVDQDFDTNVILSYNYTELITSALHPSFNTSAEITMRNLTWDAPPLVYRDGILCPEPECSNVSYNATAGIAIFNVTHFTNFTTQGNTRMEIWDETDPDKQNLTKYPNEQIKFYSNYTKKTDGSPATGATCTVDFADSAGNTLAYNATTALYEYNRSFATAGIKPYNITCSATGFQTITLSDSANVTQPDFAPYWSNNQTNLVGTYSPATPSYFNITWADDFGVSSVWFESNYSGSPDNYTMNLIAGNSTDGIYNYSDVLPAGSYYWKSHANDTSDQWNSTDQLNFFIAKALTYVNLSLNGAENNLTITYPQTITAIYSTNVLTATMYRNGTDVSSENNTPITLGAGYYNYTVINPGNANYTSSSKTFFATVNQATSTCSLVITPPNSQTYPGQVNASCSCTNPEASAVLYRNGTDVTGTENNQLTTLAAGNYAYVCNTSSTQNYTSASDSATYTINQAATALTLTASPDWTVLNNTETNITCSSNNNEVNFSLYRNNTFIDSSIGGQISDIQNLSLGTYAYICNNSATQNYTADSESNTLTVTDYIPPPPAPSGGGGGGARETCIDQCQQQAIECLTSTTYRECGLINGCTGWIEKQVIAGYICQNNQIVQKEVEITPPTPTEPTEPEEEKEPEVIEVPQPTFLDQALNYFADVRAGLSALRNSVAAYATIITNIIILIILNILLIIVIKRILKQRKEARKKDVKTLRKEGFEVKEIKGAYIEIKSIKKKPKRKKRK